MSQYDCPICNGVESLHPTNTITSRLRLMGIGASVHYVNRLCGECIDKIEFQFNTGKMPKLRTNRYEFLVFGLPRHLYAVLEQFPNLKNYIHKSYRYINYIYSRFKIPKEIKEKMMLDFGGLLAYLEEEQLNHEKNSVIEYVRNNYPKWFSTILNIIEEIVKWNKERSFRIDLIS